ncbi:MAG: Fur family transcriptional regulator [Desulfovibrionales bacterium]
MLENDKYLTTILHRAGIDPTEHRVHVLDVMQSYHRAVSAPELLARLNELCPMNKVTLYRILELFVQKGIVLRHSVGDRAFRYCLGSGSGQFGHCHFFCTSCGRTECMALSSLSFDMDRLEKNVGGQVQSMEIRLNGICTSCGHG